MTLTIPSHARTLLGLMCRIALYKYLSKSDLVFRAYAIEYFL
jgi:hypothetical protein